MNATGLNSEGDKERLMGSLSFQIVVTVRLSI